MKNFCVALIGTFALAQAASGGLITYTSPLSGLNENPSNLSPAIGFAIVTIDTVLQTMEVNVTFSGLVAGNTASHIHCCVPVGGNAGVATITPTFTGFPSGVTSGTYDHIFDLTSAGTYNPAFVTLEGSLANAETVLLAGLAADQAYLNIHTTAFPNGEIRGFLVAIPEPATFVMAGAALLALAIVGRRRVA